jgi:predicted transcriptional regulator
MSYLTKNEAELVSYILNSKVRPILLKAFNDLRQSNYESLLNTTHISYNTLVQYIRDFKERGLIMKNPENKFYLTKLGKKIYKSLDDCYQENPYLTYLDSVKNGLDMYIYNIEHDDKPDYVELNYLYAQKDLINNLLKEFSKFQYQQLSVDKEE